MTPHVIQYTVRPEEVIENDRLLAALFAELDEVKPPGLSYTVYKLADSLSYMHIIELDHGTGGAAMRLGSLKAFHEGIRGRCLAPPARTALATLGSYGAQP